MAMAITFLLTLSIWIVKFRSCLIEQHLGNRPPGAETAQNIESRIQMPLLVHDFIVWQIKTSSFTLEIFMLCILPGTQIGILILLLRLIWSPHAISDFTDTHKTILERKDLRANVDNLSPECDNHQAIFTLTIQRYIFYLNFL